MTLKMAILLIIYIYIYMNNIVFIIPAGFIRYSVVSALEVIRCSFCLVMNNEFKTNARSKYI